MNRNIRRVVSDARVASPQRPHRARIAADPAGALPQVEVLNFIAELSSDAARHPDRQLDRLLAEQGYVQGSDGDGAFSLSDTGSMSFHLDGQLSSSNSIVGQFSVGRERRTNMLAPFSCNLVYRSLAERTALEDGDTEGAGAPGTGDGGGGGGSSAGLAAWTGVATVLFIDLSGYSRISAELISQGGAHALSTAVNGYFATILDVVVNRHNGDVLTFAGDALCIAFVSNNDDRATALTAVACALEVEKRCGMFPVAGTDLFFRLHMGIAIGRITSEVFSTEARTMQRAYHFVSGEPLKELGPIVACAQKGEVCASSRVVELCGDLVQSNGEDRPPGIRLVTEIEQSYLEAFEAEPEFPLHRDQQLESDLVHPTIARKLKQGFAPQHIAEMRFLCVLFIAKTVDAVSVADWFAEVRAILDEGRAPVVQLLDDDKGVHVIAAVSLYVAELDSSNVGLRVARQLRDRESGCAIGIAAGEVFCGVTGGDEQSRWDITGPPCVKACRLMELAVALEITEAVDSTVYASTADISQLSAGGVVKLKGSLEPTTYHVLSADSITTTSGIASTMFLSPAIHREARDRLRRDAVTSDRQRAIACITGPVGVGKKSLVLSLFEMMPYSVMTHTLFRRAPPLSIAETITQWFMYHTDAEVKALASRAHGAFVSGHSVQTLNLCLQLVNATIAAGLKTVLVVQQGQFMDSLSASFLHQLALQHTQTDSGGRFLVFITVVPIFGMHQSIASAVHRGNPKVQVVKVRLTPLSDLEVQQALFSIIFWHPTQSYARAIRRKCGGLPGFIEPLMRVIRNEAVARTRRHNAGEDIELLTYSPKLGTVEMTSHGKAHITGLEWAKIAPSQCSRLSELYDVLPPRLQLQLRVLGAISCEGQRGSLLRTVATVIQKLVSRITHEQCENDFNELEGLLLVRRPNKDFVEFTSPMMFEVVTKLLTPDQARLLRRLAARASTDILEHEMATIIGSVTCEKGCTPADLYLNAAQLWLGGGDKDKFVQHMKKAAEALDQITSIDQKRGCGHRIAMTLERAGVEVEAIGSNIHKKPHRSVARGENQILLPIQWCKDSMPPFALGSYAGEVQKTCYLLVLEALSITQPDVMFVQPAFEAMLRVDVEKLVRSLQRFERAVPVPDEEKEHAIGEQEERAVFVAATTRSAKTLDDVVAKATSFREYYERVFVSRHRRIIAFVKGLNVVLRPPPGTDHKAAIATAFARLCDEDVAGAIPASAFHEALMDLATDNFKVPYMHLTLQMIRDSCLRTQTASFLDFKAMLLSFLLLGTAISGKVDHNLLVAFAEFEPGEFGSPQTPQTPLPPPSPLVASNVGAADKNATQAN